MKTLLDLTDDALALEAAIISQVEIECGEPDEDFAVVIYRVEGGKGFYHEHELSTVWCACRNSELTAEDVRRNSRDFSGLLRCTDCYEELCENAHDNAQAEEHANA